jgi:hypothetical protein
MCVPAGGKTRRTMVPFRWANVEGVKSAQGCNACNLKFYVEATMRRVTIFAVLLLLSSGNWVTLHAQDNAKVLFEQVWNEFDRSYPYFIHKNINWTHVKATHAPQISADMTASRFAEKLAAMLDILHDRHVSVTAPDGKVFGYGPAYPRNYTNSPRNRYCPGGYKTVGDNIVQHGLLIDDVAYIRINSLESKAYAGISREQINDIFTTYIDTPALIIDLRGNNGGNEEIAGWFAAHCTVEEVLYGYTKTRNGPGHGEFSPVKPKVLAPADTAPYAGVVVCLIGQKCMSSAEWFALMLKASGAILIGDRTRGASGNPKECALSNGVTYRVSTWMAFDAQMQPIEDRGIQPDIYINPEASIDGEHDYVVERALRELKSIPS